MASVKGVRARARAEIERAILVEARRQLAAVGADGLSLRAIARELGMVSSAVYRYVESRDELLTRLIIESYDSLGETAELAAAAPGTPARRWVATALAIRSWGVAHPQEYSLLYGTPVPGYQAPETTIGPASRVTFALLGIVDDAWRSGAVVDGGPITLTAPLEADLARATDLPAELVARTVAAWTQLFGLVSFELFGQTKNVIFAHEDLMRSTAEAMSCFIGLAG